MGNNIKSSNESTHNTQDINSTVNKDLLSKLSFVSDLSNEDKTYLLNNIVTRTVELSETTMNPHSCDGLIILQEGRLRVFMISQSGKEITLYHLFPNDTCVLSYNCTIGNLPFNLQVSAVEKSTVINIPAFVLNTLQDKYPSIKQFLLFETTNRLADVIGVVEKVAFSSLDTRLIELLLSQNSTIIYKTHAEFASDLGTSREIISRLLKNFEHDGLIELSRGKIKILDVKQLQSLLDK